MTSLDSGLDEDSTDAQSDEEESFFGTGAGSTGTTSELGSVAAGADEARFGAASSAASSTAARFVQPAKSSVGSNGSIANLATAAGAASDGKNSSLAAMGTPSTIGSSTGLGIRPATTAGGQGNPSAFASGSNLPGSMRPAASGTASVQQRQSAGAISTPQLEESARLQGGIGLRHGMHTAMLPVQYRLASIALLSCSAVWCRFLIIFFCSCCFADDHVLLASSGAASGVQQQPAAAAAAAAATGSTPAADALASQLAQLQRRVEQLEATLAALGKVVLQQRNASAAQTANNNAGDSAGLAAAVHRNSSDSSTAKAAVNIATSGDSSSGNNGRDGGSSDGISGVTTASSGGGNSTTPTAIASASAPVGLAKNAEQESDKIGEALNATWPNCCFLDAFFHMFVAFCTRHGCGTVVFPTPACLCHAPCRG